MAKLTARQQKWIEEYMVDLNATQACLRAGYSKKSIKQQGTENLANPSLMAEVNKLKEARSKKTGITAEYVLNAAAKLHTRCMGEEAIIDSDGLTDIDEGGKVKKYPFNAAGAGKAIELMGKHVNVQAWKEKIEVSADESLIEVLESARRRLKNVAP